MSNPGARRRLVLLGFPPLLVALLLVAYATSLYVRSSLRVRGVAAGDKSRVRQWFAANNTALNLVEQVGRAVRRGRCGRCSGGPRCSDVVVRRCPARSAPPTEECRVRTNLGLVTQARADQLQPGDVDGARVLQQWGGRAATAPCVEPDRVDTSPARTVGAPDPPDESGQARSALSDDGRTGPGRSGRAAGREARGRGEGDRSADAGPGPPGHRTRGALRRPHRAGTPGCPRPTQRRGPSESPATARSREPRRTSSSRGATGTYNW